MQIFVSVFVIPADHMANLHFKWDHIVKTVKVIVLSMSCWTQLKESFTEKISKHMILNITFVCLAHQDVQSKKVNTIRSLVLKTS